MSGISGSPPSYRLVTAYSPMALRENADMKVAAICNVTKQLHLRGDEDIDLWQMDRNADLSNWMCGDSIEVKVNMGSDSSEYSYTLVNDHTKAHVSAQIINTTYEPS
jgi:hypothetical protein